MKHPFGCSPALGLCVARATLPKYVGIREGLSDTQIEQFCGQIQWYAPFIYIVGIYTIKKGVQTTGEVSG